VKRDESGLKGKQRRHLRGLGVHLKPVVHLGKNEMSPPVLEEMQAALAAHELIKVRLLDSVAGKRKEVARQLAERAGAELVQVLGRTVLLYRRNEKEPVIELPA
jgi:RNA-binding protein